MTHTLEQIQNCSIFRGAPEKALQQLAGSSVVTKYPKKGCVFNVGDPTDELYILVEGRVCFEVYTETGKKLTLGIAEPPRCIGDLELFRDSPRTSRATVLEDVIAIEIPKHVFLAACQETPAIYEKFVKIYAQRLHEVGLHLRIREDDKLLCHYLLHNATRFGTLINGNPVVDLSQDTLSSIIGIPRQRINRILNQWKKEGLIEIKYGNIVITNLDAMYALNMG